MFTFTAVLKTAWYFGTWLGCSVVGSCWLDRCVVDDDCYLRPDAPQQRQRPSMALYESSHSLIPCWRMTFCQHSSLHSEGNCNCKNKQKSKQKQENYLNLKLNWWFCVNSGCCGKGAILKNLKHSRPQAHHQDYLHLKLVRCTLYLRLHQNYRCHRSHIRAPPVLAMKGNSTPWWKSKPDVLGRWESKPEKGQSSVKDTDLLLGACVHWRGILHEKQCRLCCWQV